MALKELGTWANQVGFSFQKPYKTAYGVYGGYAATVRWLPSKQYFLFMNVTGRESEGWQEKEQGLRAALEKLPLNTNFISYTYLSEHQLGVYLEPKGREDGANLTWTLGEVVRFVAAWGGVNGCEACEKPGALSFFGVNGLCRSLCADCSGKVLGAYQQENKKKGNMPLGLLGAFLGTLLGAVLWVVVYQIGYIVGLVGFAIAAGAIWGYQKLSGKLTKKGLIWSLVIAVIMLAAGEFVAIAWDLYQLGGAFGYTFWDCCTMVIYLLAEPDVLWPVLGELGMGYFFMFLASFGFVRRKAHEVLGKGEVVPLPGK